VTGGAVNALTQSDSAVYAGGAFTQIGGGTSGNPVVNVTGLVSLSPSTGGVSTGWNNPSVVGGNVGVQTLSLSTNGNLLVGGDFTGVQPSTAVRYVRYFDIVDAATGNIK
jgi:hypothetical protein